MKKRKYEGRLRLKREQIANLNITNLNKIWGGTNTETRNCTTSNTVNECNCQTNEPGCEFTSAECTNPGINCNATGGDDDGGIG